MKRQRAFGATELLIATSLLAFGVATACGGGGDNSSSSGGAGAGGAAGSNTGGQGQGGGSSGKSGSGGQGGKGGMTSASAGANEAGAGTETPDGGPATGGDSGAGGQPDDETPVNTSLARLGYPAVKFPPENPDAAAKDMLGKILFWDEQVGSDNTMACGTCHRTGTGGGSDPRALTTRSAGDDGILGTDDDVHGSQGIKYCTSGDNPTVAYAVAPDGNPNKVFGLNHQVTPRKAPSYLDAMAAPNIFWDGRALSQFVDPNPAGGATPAVLIAAGGALESQSVGPPMNPGEMACAGRTWATLLAKLGSVVPLNLATDIPADMKAAINAANGTYSQLFLAAFGSGEITASHFAMAIATHERHLTSNQTPWDLYNAYLNDPSTGDRHALTAAQVHGLDIFLNKASCATCHLPPFFSDFGFHNLGFVSSAVDKGTQGLAGSTAVIRGQVKTAGLRNVGLRSPTDPNKSQGLFHYGHGPGATLETVIAAYNNPPVVAGEPTPATQATSGDTAVGSAIRPLGLSSDEVTDLIDFLRNGLTDPRVQNQAYPFDKPTLSTE
jgi:cytochrome c peroxidase